MSQRPIVLWVLLTQEKVFIEDGGLGGRQGQCFVLLRCEWAEKLSFGLWCPTMVTESGFQFIRRHSLPLFRKQCVLVGPVTVWPRDLADSFFSSELEFPGLQVQQGPRIPSSRTSGWSLAYSPLLPTASCKCQVHWAIAYPPVPQARGAEWIILAGGAITSASSCSEPSPGGWLGCFDTLSEHGVQCVGSFIVCMAWCPVRTCLIIVCHWGHLE